MDVLLDYSLLLGVLLALYGWYAPMLLVLISPGLAWRDKSRWLLLCVLGSWLAYWWLRQHLFSTSHGKID